MPYIQLLLPLIYAPWYYFSFVELWHFVFFVVGLYGGVIFMTLDKKLFFRYYLDFTQQQQPKKNYITRSLLFVLVYVVLSIFLVTSSGSSLGVGLIQGIGLQLIWEFIQAKQKNIDINTVITTGNKPLNAKEGLWFTRAFITFFVVISILIFI